MLYFSICPLQNWWKSFIYCFLNARFFFPKHYFFNIYYWYHYMNFHLWLEVNLFLRILLVKKKTHTQTRTYTQANLFLHPLMFTSLSCLPEFPRLNIRKLLEIKAQGWPPLKSVHLMVFIFGRGKNSPSSLSFSCLLLLMIRLIYSIFYLHFKSLF